MPASAVAIRTPSIGGRVGYDLGASGETVTVLDMRDSKERSIGTATCGFLRLFVKPALRLAS
ncbi:hypothetical protein MAE02_04280 [Microvirga aerophila]|uniref:Uncharacterized protein n=1 Tax=Microvirga aerophila TaxID=670291 RepID=A0A512BL88_9HYPH|nr:hypothetical protein MAE02_04280 [Microvirga aerophila]